MAIEVTAAKDGVGPVLKGQAGVNQVAANTEAAGGKVLGVTEEGGRIVVTVNPFSGG